MSVFGDAEAFWHAGLYAGSGVLKDLTDNGHNATINGATWLPHTGRNYIHIPADNDATGLNQLYANEKWDNPTSSFEVRHFGRIYHENDQNWWFLWNYAWYVRLTSTGLCRFYWQESDNTVRTNDVGTFPAALVGEWVEVSWLIEWDGSTTYTLTSRYRENGAGDWTTISSTTQAATGAGGFKTQSGQGILSQENNRNDNLWIARLTYLIDGVTVARLDGPDMEPQRTALNLDGTTDAATIPEESALVVTAAGLDLRALVNHTAAAQDAILGRWGSGDAFVWRIGTSGEQEIHTNQGGATKTFIGSAVSCPTNSLSWVRMTWIPATGVVNYYNSPDGETWNLVETGNNGSTSFTDAGTSGFRIGAQSSVYDQSWAGQILWVQYRHGVNGTIAFEHDFRDNIPGSPTLTATTGQTITLAGNAAIIPDGQYRLHDSTPTRATINADNDGMNVPHSSAWTPTTSLDYRGRFTWGDFADWQQVGGQWTETGDQGAWGLWLTGTGTSYGAAGYLELDMSTDGTWTPGPFIGSTAAMPFAGTMTTAWLRVHFDQVEGWVDFYYSLDDTNDDREVEWTQLGTRVTNAPWTLYDSSATFDIGVYDSENAPAEAMQGEAHAAALIIDGASVFRSDFGKLAPGVTEWEDDYGSTVSVLNTTALEGGSNAWILDYRDPSAAAIVDAPMFLLDGVDDSIEVPDHADLDFDFSDRDATVIVLARFQSPANLDIICAKRQSGTPTGWQLQWGSSDQFTFGISTGGGITGDPFTFSSNYLTGPGVLHTLGGYHDSAQTTEEGRTFADDGGNAGLDPGNGYNHGGSDNLSNSENLYFGRHANSVNYGAFQFLGAAIWRRALTNAEITEVYQRMLNIYDQDEPALKLEIAFDDDPFDASPTWTDISSDVRAISVQRGAGSAERDEIRAGVASFALNNHDADFSPWNTVQNMKPMSRIRAKLIWQAIPYPAFDGYLESVDVDWLHDNYSVATLRAVDGFKALSFFETATTQVEELTGTRIGNWLDDASWPTAERLLDAGSYSAAAHSATCEAVLALIRSTVDLETPVGKFFIGRDGVAIFHDNDHVYQPGGTYGELELAYDSLDVEWNDAQIWNEVTAVATDGSSVSVSDATSIATYFKRTLKVFDSHAKDNTDLTAVANAALAKYKDPAVSIRRLRVNPRSNDALWPRVLADDLGQPITVIRRPGEGPALNQSLTIRGYTLTGSPKKWAVVYDLAP